MDQNSKLFYQSALALKLSCTIEDSIHAFYYTLGRKRFFMHGVNIPLNNAGSVSVARNKYCVNQLLKKAGISAPKATAITQADFLQNEFNLTALLHDSDIHFPIVVKPTCDTNSGKDVFCKIKNEEVLRTYLTKMFMKYTVISIEEFISDLKSYRILVLDNAVIGVTERIPAYVTGDGVHTLEELIKMVNTNTENIHGCIDIFEEQREKMAEMQITLTDIIQAGRVIQLAYKCNATEGGTTRAADYEICDENREFAITAAKTLELDFVGFDIMCENIGKPIHKTRGYIIEANYNPDITIHETPTEGKPNQVTKLILKACIKRHRFAYWWERIKIKNTHVRFYFRFFIVLFSILALHKTIHG